MKNLLSKLKVNAIFAIIIILMVLAAFLLNGILLVLSNRYTLSTDLTANAAYEIGEDSKTLLRSLSAPVNIYVMSTAEDFTGSPYLDQARRILDQYPRYAELVTVTYVDYAADPTFATNFPDLSLQNGDLIVQSGAKTKHIIVANLFNYTQDSAGALTITSSRAEEALTSAILNVTSGDRIRVAVLTGNGVTAVSTFAALLADNNYELAEINLTTDSLTGFDVALLIAPTVDLSEDVIRKLDDFLYNGGAYGTTLFYTASLDQAPMHNLDTFLEEWGIRFHDGAVFETVVERTYQNQYYSPLAFYQDSDLTRMLRDTNTPFLMPLSRPLEILFTAKDGRYIEVLLAFSDTSGVRPADAPSTFTASEATVFGPMPALVIASVNAKTASGEFLQSNIVAASSTEMIGTMPLYTTSLTNSEYLLNLFAKVTNRDDVVHIQSKTLSGQQLGVNSAQAITLGVVLVGLIPLAILGTGIAVWLVRRHK